MLEAEEGCQAIHPPPVLSAAAPRALLAAQRSQLPSLQLRGPRGCSPTSAPSACPEQEPISPAGGEHGPQIGLASPWERTQDPRGDSRTRPLPWPPGQGPLASWSPSVPTLPLPCAAAPQRQGTQGGSSWGLLFPRDPLPKSLFCSFIWEIAQTKDGKGSWWLL